MTDDKKEEIFIKGAKFRAKLSTFMIEQLKDLSINDANIVMAVFYESAMEHMLSNIIPVTATESYLREKKKNILTDFSNMVKSIVDNNYEMFVDKMLDIIKGHKRVNNIK
jgi:hypothetical protein